MHACTVTEERTSACCDCSFPENYMWYSRRSIKWSGGCGIRLPRIQASSSAESTWRVDLIRLARIFWRQDQLAHTPGAATTILLKYFATRPSVRSLPE